MQGEGGATRAAVCRTTKYDAPGQCESLVCASTPGSGLIKVVLPRDGCRKGEGMRIRVEALQRQGLEGRR
jgi:hypothetical protein